MQARLAVDRLNKASRAQYQSQNPAVQKQETFFRYKNKHLMPVIFIFAFIYIPSPSHRLVLQGENINIAITDERVSCVPDINKPSHHHRSYL